MIRVDLTFDLFDLFLLFTECKPYWYGNGCSKQCSCQDTKEACEVKTGFCKSGCPEDKTGPACDSKTNYISFSFLLLKTKGQNILLSSLLFMNIYILKKTHIYIYIYIYI